MINICRDGTNTGAWSVAMQRQKPLHHRAIKITQENTLQKGTRVVCI